jgi:hypothetical protein
MTAVLEKAEVAEPITETIDTVESPVAVREVTLVVIGRGTVTYDANVRDARMEQAETLFAQGRAAGMAASAMAADGATGTIIRGLDDPEIDAKVVMRPALQGG